MEKFDFEQLPNNSEKQEKYHYNDSRFEYVVPPLKKLCETLRHRFENGEYDVIISDEVRARIPTLIIKKVMTGLNANKVPETYFIASGRGTIDSKSIKEFAQSHNLGNKKILIVTEYISRGGSIMNLCRVLKDDNVVDHEIACLSLNHHYLSDDGKKEWEQIVSNEELKNHEIFIGEYGEGFGATLHDMSGVTKNIAKGDEIVGAHPIKSNTEQEKVNLSRIDVNTAAQEILDSIRK